LFVAITTTLIYIVKTNLMGLVAESRKRLDGASLSGSPATFFLLPILLLAHPDGKNKLNYCGTR
jgi:hypothetical protein